MILNFLHQTLRESVQIRSFFWYVFSLIQTEYGPEKISYLDTFHAVKVIPESNVNIADEFEFGEEEMTVFLLN